MKNYLSKKTIALAGAAVLLTAGLNVGSALSYFTAYTEASGSATINLGPSTEITENFENWVKTVTVTNSGVTPCYVRVKVVAGDLYAEDIKVGIAEKWTDGGDDYYYYNDILQPKASTGEFTIQIPVPAADAADFNVIVVEEQAPVVYENGIPSKEKSWNLRAVPGSGSGGQNQGAGTDKEGDK